MDTGMDDPPAVVEAFDRAFAAKGIGRHAGFIDDAVRAARWTAVLALAAVPAACSHPEPPSPAREPAMEETRIAAEDAEVLEAVEALNRAFAADDPEAYFALIDDGITVLTPSNPYRVEGIEDDREEFEWGLETGRSRVGYFQEMQPRVQRFGDVAVVTYYSRGSYGPDEKVTYLKETDVLVKRPEGWRFVHIHVSATP